MTLRWDPCVVQDASEFELFLKDFINKQERRCLLVGGAGFDPRATVIPEKFSGLTFCKTTGIFFREERILDQTLLRSVADNAQRKVAEMIPDSAFPKIDIFAEGVTAVGGRKAIEEVGAHDLSNFSDIFVDVSALSSGVFFPIVKFLIGHSESKGFNLHLVTAEQPQFDHCIRGIPADAAAMLHGFKGSKSLDSSDTEALLWIPTLAPGHRDCLTKIYQFIQRKDTPIDVCPILPFPGSRPRLPDQLVDEYRELLATWRVDHRNFLYAAESDTLDSYRAISTLFCERTVLFSKLGGSQVILSPLGNKMLSVGAMLAAVEQNLAVAMVESVGYDENLATGEQSDNYVLKHVWLCGEAYFSGDRQ